MEEEAKNQIELAKEMLPDVSDRFIKKIFDPNEIHKEFVIHITVSIAKKVNNAPILTVLQYTDIFKETWEISDNCFFCNGKGTVHWRKNIYYCHECNAQMNAVDFLMAYSKMSYEDAFRTVLECILDGME